MFDAEFLHDIEIKTKLASVCLFGLNVGRTFIALLQ